jgi:hypothetical protein
MSANYPNNYAPASKFSSVSHLPGQSQEGVKNGDDYTFEFEDSLLSYQGHRNVRLDGSKVTSLWHNQYNPKGAIQYYGQRKHPNIEKLGSLTREWTGDINHDKNPVVQTYTSTVFFGTSLAGYQEDRRYPNVGEDFSYIFIEKAFTFDPETDEYFITEMLSPEDDVFERVLKQDMSYANKFNLRLLDEGVENDLQQQYTIHFNAGLFSLIATYTTCSEYPYGHEMCVTTQYAAKDQTYNYYGVNENRYENGLPSQNEVFFSLNPNLRSIITGSFIVEKNPDTWWWRRPQTSSFFNGSSGHTTASGHTDLTKLTATSNRQDSVYGFINRLAFSPHTFEDNNENIKFGTPPAEQDLHILTYNNAKGCVRDVQYEKYFGTNRLQALRHFGSVSLSPGDRIPLPGMTGKNPSIINSSGMRMNFQGIVSPSFNEYAVQTYWDSNSPQTKYTYYGWFMGGDDVESAPHFPVPNNITGSGNFNYIPRLDTFTISKLEKRINVIMADINKVTDLYDGVGGKGFVCIPENLHPAIKNNLDYYLKKAELIDKGPNRKNIGAKNSRILRGAPKSKGNHLNP